jgi:phosphatidate cytidylyltransferase
MLRQRIITAVLLVAGLLVLLFLLPPAALQLAIAVVLAAAAWEWTHLCGLGRSAAAFWYPVALTVVGSLLTTRRLDDWHAPVFALALLWWLLAAGELLRYPRGADWLRRPTAGLVAGGFVLLPAWLAFHDITGLPDARFYLLWFIGLVAAADIGAYFAGRAFGRRKLAPQVSPNKTLEGFVGGVIATVAVAAAGTAWLAPASLDTGKMPLILLAAAVLAPLSVVGDLFESLLKRQQGLKDSSHLLPGHGGVMDRLDSLTAALPFYALLLAGVVRHG